MSKSVTLTASILAADFSKLQAEMDAVEPYVDGFQVDVMDGHFVPNLSFGTPVVKWIQTARPLDIHLMVTNPADRIAEFAALKVAHMTFHAEAVAATEHRRALLRAIRATGATCGIAINPSTPVSAIDDVITEVDLVLVMSVQPGFSGQEFLTAVLDKVRILRSAYPDLTLQIDGGIDTETARLAVQAGANTLVIASAIFGAKDRKAATEALRKAANGIDN